MKHNRIFSADRPSERHISRVRRPMLALALLALLAMVQSPAEGALPQDRDLSKSFQVGKGGNLEISISGGTIRVKGWDRDEVSVKVSGLDIDEQNTIELTQDGNTVRVRDRSHRGRSGDMLVSVSVPSQFDLDVKTAGGEIVVDGPLSGKLRGVTAGGDIRLGNLGGNLKMTTSGGDIESGEFNGDLTVTTAGGDIRVRSISGQGQVSTSGGEIEIENAGKSLKANTSGGNIRVGNIGGDARVSTSGGDVEVGKVSGTAHLSTSGGNITLHGATGSVTAATSGGDLMLDGIAAPVRGSTAGGNVQATLVSGKVGRSQLATAGGNIHLTVPDNAQATIHARIKLQGRWGSKDEYDIRSDFKVEDLQKSEDEIRGVIRLNGGGEEITLETSNGNIEVRKGR